MGKGRGSLFDQLKKIALNVSCKVLFRRKETFSQFSVEGNRGGPSRSHLQRGNPWVPRDKRLVGGPWELHVPRKYKVLYLGSSPNLTSPVRHSSVSLKSPLWIFRRCKSSTSRVSFRTPTPTFSFPESRNLDLFRFVFWWFSVLRQHVSTFTVERHGPPTEGGTLFFSYVRIHSFLNFSDNFIPSSDNVIPSPDRLSPPPIPSSPPR